MKHLSKAELIVMEAAWELEEPILTRNLNVRVAEQGAQWKAQTILTLLRRIEEKGFLRSDKKGKERNYYVLISKEEYCAFETEYFMKHFYPNSLVGFLGNVFSKGQITNEDLDELEEFVRARKGAKQ